MDWRRVAGLGGYTKVFERLKADKLGKPAQELANYTIEELLDKGLSTSIQVKSAGIMLGEPLHNAIEFIKKTAIEVDEDTRIDLDKVDIDNDPWEGETPTFFTKALRIMKEKMYLQIKEAIKDLPYGSVKEVESTIKGIMETTLFERYAGWTFRFALGNLIDSRKQIQDINSDQKVQTDDYKPFAPERDVRNTPRSTDMEGDFSSDKWNELNRSENTNVNNWWDIVKNTGYEQMTQIIRELMYSKKIYSLEDIMEALKRMKLPYMPTRQEVQRIIARILGR
tara:strand:- start:180 stop:1022 length:843 start_codon:yes stop_codon:yes gene_type:complete